MHANATYVGFRVHPLYAASPDNFSILVCYLLGFSQSWELSHSEFSCCVLSDSGLKVFTRGLRSVIWNFSFGGEQICSGWKPRKLEAEDWKEARSCIDASGKKGNFL